MGGMKDLFGDTPYHYPTRPGFKEHGSTSEEAAQSVSGRAPTLRQAVLDLIKWEPLTADEAAARLGETVLAIRPRLSELRAQGLIVPTGVRRKNKSGKDAQVWRSAGWGDR